MKKSYLLLFTSLFGLLTACSKEEEAKPVVNTVTIVTASIDNLQQVPSNSSTARGTFTGTYNSTTNVLDYTVTFQGLVPTSAHIHTGAPGATGPVVIPFTNPDVSPIKGTFTLTPELAEKLLNNGTYVNLHTNTLPAYRSGEIRGDIRKQ